MMLLAITSCGFGNNLYLIGYNLTEFMPNKYKVTDKIEDDFPKNGLAIVDLNFRVNNEKDGINTVWRRINEDGTYSKRMALTYIDVFKRGRVRVVLEPGTYFLDGLRYPDGNKYISIGAFNKMYSNKQKGWDENKEKPLYFSFVAKKGKELKIPDIFVFANCRNSRNSCSGESLELSIFIDERAKIKNNNYQTGINVQKLNKNPLY